MTVDQANDINNLFVMYNDSIKTLNKIIWRQKYDVSFAERQVKLSDEIVKVADSIVTTKEAETAYYKKRITRAEQLEYVDKRTRKRVTWGIIGTVIAWGSFVILIITKG